MSHQLQTSDFDLWIEFIDIGDEERFPLVHCTFHRWSPSIMKDFMAAWPGFRSEIKSPVFCCSPNDDEKFVKFVTRFGFRFFSNFIGPDDQEHKMFLHI